MLPRTKTIYHPNFIAGYYLKILLANLLKQIPRSTQHNWNVKQQLDMFGSDWGSNNRERLETLSVINNNQKLLAINKSLVKIIAIKKYIARYANRIKDGIGQADKIVLKHIKKAAEVLGLNPTLSFIQISLSFYYRLRKPKKCSFSLINLCRVRHPTQLLEKQVEIIKEYAQNELYNHWPLSSVFHQILRDGTAFFCLSTFYKYVFLLGIKRAKPSNRRTNHKTGIGATKCLQILHADITEFKTADNKKVNIYLIIDNYSRGYFELAGQLLTQGIYCFRQYIKSLSAIFDSF